MVPYSERRHRIHGIELPYVEEEIHRGLVRRLEEKEDLLGASILFRLWYRIHTHCTNKPKYPDHDTWEAMASYMNYGTETPPLISLLRPPDR